MSIPHRILRAEGREYLGKTRNKTAREVEREDEILNVTQHLMCSHSRADVTMKVICASVDITYATLHRHFADLEEIFGRILLRHLDAVFNHINKIPWETPDRGPAIRAAYRTFTRTAFGAHTNIHHLFLAHAGTLPPDIAEQIDRMRRMIGTTLVGPEATATAMALLDSLELDGPELETLLTALQAAARQAAARIEARRAGNRPQEAAREPAKPPPKPILFLPAPVELAKVRSDRAKPPSSSVDARAGPH